MGRGRKRGTHGHGEKKGHRHARAPAVDGDDRFYKQLRIPGFSIAHKVTGKVASDDCISYNVITLYIIV